jgi:hypothetical protein
MQVDRDMGGAAGDPRRRRAHGLHDEGDEDKIVGGSRIQAMAGGQVVVGRLRGRRGVRERSVTAIRRGACGVGFRRFPEGFGAVGAAGSN